MKKFLFVLISVILIMSFGSCQKKTVEELSAFDKAFADAKAMTHEQIVEKAKAEAEEAKTAGSVFKAYATSSRIANAGKSFTELYGIDVETTNVKDSEVYTKLNAEIEGNIDGADVVLTQNGAVLKIQMIDTGYLVNYIPSAYANSISSEDQNPLIQQYINKLFILNTVNKDSVKITNAWQLCEPQMKGSIFFKSPETEKVNENFLIMLTSPQWSEKLAKAYKDLYGKDIELGEFKNAGYKWIAEFLGNCSFGDSDTKLAEQLSNDEATGKLGLFVFSKLRSKTVKTENLEVASFYADTIGSKMEPFAGFMYPLYAMIAKTSTMPFTSMLFVEHLVSKEGFAPWGKDIGAYSSNNNISVNDGDKDLAYWKERLVMDDPEYINKAYGEVFEFISKYLSK